MGEPCWADEERFDSVVMSDDDDKDTGIENEKRDLLKGVKSAEKYSDYR